MTRLILDKIMFIVDSALAELGYECIEVEWVSHERALVVYMDSLSAETEVSMQDCSRAHRLLLDRNDFMGLVPDHAHIQLSSPGVERPLRKQAHLASHIGQNIEVSYLCEGKPLSDKATLLSVDDLGIHIDGEAMEKGFVSFANLIKCSTVYDWSVL